VDFFLRKAHLLWHLVFQLYQGKTRIRVMIPVAHQQDDQEKSLDAFARAGCKLGVIA
jgi:hypothetical protein